MSTDRIEAIQRELRKIPKGEVRTINGVRILRFSDSPKHFMVYDECDVTYPLNYNTCTAYQMAEQLSKVSDGSNLS